MTQFVIASCIVLCGYGDAKSERAAPIAPGLPAEWHGVWKGRCVSEDATGRTQEFAMELHIRPIAEGKLAWQIVYGEGERRQVRPYELHVDPARPGKLVMDEKNGILLDCQRFGSILQCQFQVDKNLIVSRDELTSEGIRVEITTFDAAAPRATSANAGRFQVRSFPAKAIQRGLLRRAS